MKTTKIAFLFVFMATIVTYAVATTRSLTASSAFDQPFDTYGDISWDDERARLDNFAVALQQEPNYVGYIIVYAGKRACLNEAQFRARRAKKYLMDCRSIQGNRIIWLDGGYHENLEVILQPVLHGALKPDISPTIKPNDVTIINNCRTDIGNSNKKQKKGKSQSLCFAIR